LLDILSVKNAANSTSKENEETAGEVQKLKSGDFGHNDIRKHNLKRASSK